MSYPVIREIPPHAEVIGVGHAHMNLHAAHRDNIVALLLDTANPEVLILVSNEAPEAVLSFLAPSQAAHLQGVYNTAARPSIRLAATEQIEQLYLSDGDGLHYQTADATDAATSRRYIRQFRELLSRALREQASDIHIENRPGGTRVRFRVHGLLKTVERWHLEQADTFCRVVYNVLARNQSVNFNPRVPQDGVIEQTIQNGTVRIRVSSLPSAPDLYDLILRIQNVNEDQQVPGLDELGYSAEQGRLIGRIVDKASGMVIISGVVGSGKTTSLRSMIVRQIARADGAIKVITVEDPPEYHIPGATQVAVVRGHGRENQEADEFADTLRGVMRADFDAIMIGEIRDGKSATLAAKIAQSGHRVYTTVHAAGAIAIIPRLSGLGIQREVISNPDVIAGMLYQALLPVICEHCALGAAGAADGALLRRIERHGDPAAVRLRNNAGCRQCHHSGVRGRTVVAEVVQMTHELARLFRANHNLEAQRHWLEQAGGTPVSQHALARMLHGEVDPHDVELKFGDLAQTPPYHVTAAATAAAETATADAAQ